MSRYVSVVLELSSREQLLAALGAVGLGTELEVAAAGDALMLAGSLECAGEPVEIRLPPGTFDTVEDFGFVSRGGEYALVCGELDRGRLERELLPRLRAQAAIDAVRAAAAARGEVVEQHVETDGTRRLVIKRKE